MTSFTFTVHIKLACRRCRHSVDLLLTVVKCTMPPDFFLLQLLVIHTTIENTIGVGFAEERIKTIANNNTDAIVL